MKSTYSIMLGLSNAAEEAITFFNTLSPDDEGEEAAMARIVQSLNTALNATQHWLNEEGR